MQENANDLVIARHLQTRNAIRALNRDHDPFCGTPWRVVNICPRILRLVKSASPEFLWPRACIHLHQVGLVHMIIRCPDNTFVFRKFSDLVITS